MDWQTIDITDFPPTGQVLACHEPTGKMMLGHLRDFDGADGMTRRGIQIGFGIFRPTHYAEIAQPKPHTVGEE